jgi:hypothetical protein
MRKLKGPLLGSDVGLNKIRGIEILKDSIPKRPRIPIVALEDSDVVDKLLDVFDWVASSLKEEDPKDT